MKLDVLYEDNHLIVVYKEAGILSQSDNTEREDIISIVKAYLIQKYNKQGDAYVGLIQRLDTNTKGVMVLAKTSKAAKRLCNDIIQNNVEKKYLAVVTNGKNIPKSGRFTDYLRKNERTNQSLVVDKKYGKLAILDYCVLAQIDDYALVDINLVTGRHHQIRAQFASRSYPLYGDVKYGAQKNSDYELGLQAYSSTITHPTTKKILSFEKIRYEGIFKIFETNKVE